MPTRRARSNPAASARSEPTATISAPYAGSATASISACSRVPVPEIRTTTRAGTGLTLSSRTRSRHRGADRPSPPDQPQQQTGDQPGQAQGGRRHDEQRQQPGTEADEPRACPGHRWPPRPVRRTSLRPAARPGRRPGCSRRTGPAVARARPGRRRPRRRAPRRPATTAGARCRDRPPAARRGSGCRAADPAGCRPGPRPSRCPVRSRLRARTTRPRQHRLGAKASWPSSSAAPPRMPGSRAAVRADDPVAVQGQRGHDHGRPGRQQHELGGQHRPGQGRAATPDRAARWTSPRLGRCPTRPRASSTATTAAQCSGACHGSPKKMLTAKTGAR